MHSTCESFVALQQCRGNNLETGKDDEILVSPPLFKGRIVTTQKLVVSDSVVPKSRFIIH
ncbi:hypothetical protein EPI10_011656 [Gossypium australe]|uniref:Uncharacterized protein n=1 Tax=Gossypium australe TaxID=47621 RepID=A0A5B6W9A0_9ROSI|nr:hypothetical protein EPI10_011656 [Gossypium australe]